MIIFLYGRDGYRLKQSLDLIVAEYRKKHSSGMSFSVLDPAVNGGVAAGRAASVVGPLEDIVKTVSFFNEKKLVVLKNVFSFAPEISPIIKEYDLVKDKEHILVFVESLPAAELAKRNKNFFALLGAKPNVTKEFEPLSSRKLETWLANEATSLGANIEPQAVKKLISFAGNDSWRLRLELEKLANYSQGRPIGEEEVELLVSPNVSLNIFETIDAIGNKNKIKAVTLLQKHLEAGEDPYYLFSMFVYQFRNLLRVKSLAGQHLPQAVIVKRTGLHPFVVRKALDQAGKFELEELKQKFSHLAEADVEIKNGLLDVTDFLFRVALS